MSLITRFLTAVTEPQFMLARDLMAVALADGDITPEEHEAISTICHLEGVDEEQLMQALKSSKAAVPEIPTSIKEREEYLRNLILLIGADSYSAPQEIFIFQIIASKMGLSQMNVMGLFLLNTTHQYFQGNTGIKVMTSFLKNYIDPKYKTEEECRKSLRTIYETIAINTEQQHDKEADRQLLQQTLSRATEALAQNKILITEYSHIGLDFLCILQEEEITVLEEYWRR